MRRLRWYWSPAAVLLAVLAVASLPTIAEAAPANDRFSEARPLGSGPLPFALASTRGAGRQYGEPLHAGHGGRGASIWFRWRAGGARDLAVRACPLAGRGGPVAVAVYRGRRLGNLSEVGSAVLHPSGLGCEGTGPAFKAVAGRSYRIAVQTPSPGTEGLLVSFGDVPPPAEAATTGLTSPARTRPLRRSFAISRRPWSKPRAIVSVPLSGLGALERGARLLGSAELQLSVCAKPAGGGRRHDCFGRQYGFNPRVRGRLMISRSPTAARGSPSRPLGPARTLRCRGRQPNRNHHCAMTLGWNPLRLGKDGQALPRCAPLDCWLVLVASASHRQARPGHRVVVGGVQQQGIKRRGSVRLSALRQNATAPRTRTLRAKTPRSRPLPLVRAGRGIRLGGLLSLRVPRPRAGETLRIDGRVVSRLGRLPYNARTRTRLVLSDRPLAVRPGPRARRLAAGSPWIGTTTYFNCTRGWSAHRSPCLSRKPGLIRFRVSSDRPLFVNLLAGHGAIGERSHRYRKRDRMRATGRLIVERLRP